MWFFDLRKEEAETQTGALIKAIRRNPGISRSELFDLRVNGARIAWFTARITEARWILAKNGETVVCEHLAPLKKWNATVRRTAYRIVKLTGS